MKKERSQSLEHMTEEGDVEGRPMPFIICVKECVWSENTSMTLEIRIYFLGTKPSCCAIPLFPDLLANSQCTSMDERKRGWKNRSSGGEMEREKSRSGML